MLTHQIPRKRSPIAPRHGAQNKQNSSFEFRTSSRCLRRAPRLAAKVFLVCGLLLLSGVPVYSATSHDGTTKTADRLIAEANTLRAEWTEASQRKALANNDEAASGLLASGEPRSA